MDILQELYRIQGFDKILKTVNQLFSTYQPIKLYYLVDGIKVQSTLPYILEIKYFENDGWNIFLISMDATYPNDKASFIIYEQFGKVIQSLNLQLFGYVHREGFIREFWKIA